MKKSIHRLIERVSIITVFVQTSLACKRSATLKAKLVGEELRLHLEQNTRKCIKKLEREYEEMRAGQRPRLVCRWDAYVTKYAPLFESRPNETADAVAEAAETETNHPTII